MFRPLVPFIVAKLLFLSLGGPTGLLPHTEDYWSPFNHWWHIYSKTWAFFVRPYFVKLLQGTVFINWFFMAATLMKIGDYAYIAQADAFREHDLVRIGDYSIINSFAEFRTHTFENWKLKFEYITIGDHCCVGHSSTIMGGAILEHGSEVGNNTLVMKKETLQSAIFYSGLPAQPIGPTRKIPQKKQKVISLRARSSKKESDDYVIFVDD